MSDSYISIHARDSEVNLIGLMADSHEARTIARTLLPGGHVLTDRRVKILWDVMQDLDARGEYSNLLTLVDELQARPPLREGNSNLLDEINSSWLTKISHRSYTASYDATNLHAPEGDTRTLCRHILDAAKRRTVSRFIGKILPACHVSGGGERLAQELQGVLQALDGLTTEDIDAIHVKHIGQELMRGIQAAMEGAKSPRLSTGIDCFDKLIDGFVPGSYVILSSYSKHGKTTVASAMVAGLIQEHNAVVNIHQCEVSQTTQLARVLAAAFADDRAMNQSWLTRPDKLDPEARVHLLMKAADAMGAFGKRDVYIEKPGLLRIEKIESRARMLRTRYPDRPLVIVVDYLQRVTAGEHRDKHADLEQVSGRLIGLAKETGAIVLTLSQYTEQGHEQAPVGMPLASQIRGGRDARNDADLLLTWHRPYAFASHHRDLGVLEIGVGRELESAHVAIKADLGMGTFAWWEDALPHVPALQTERRYRGGREPDDFETASSQGGAA